MVTRFRSIAAAGLLLLCGLIAPALAGVRADFNRDGVLDSATIVSGAQPHILVTLSGTDRHVLLLPLKEDLLSLVAADLDHDGLTDLAGVTKQTGVLVWKNRGGQRFSGRQHALDRRARGGFAVASGRHGLSPDPFSPDSLDPAAATGDDHQRLVPPIAGGLLNPVSLTSSQVRAADRFLPDALFSRSAAARAPPRRSR
jgi:hypothetical protein